MKQARALWGTVLALTVGAGAWACVSDGSNANAVLPDAGNGGRDSTAPGPGGGGADAAGAGDASPVDGALEASSPTGEALVGMDINGNLVRVGVDATGTDTILFKPVFPNGRSLLAVAREPVSGVLYAYIGDARNPSLYVVDETLKSVSPAGAQFQNGGSGRPLLAASAGKVWTIDQTSPVYEMATTPDASTVQHSLSIVVAGADGGQCHTPLDLVAAPPELKVAALCAAGPFGVSQRSIATVTLNADGGAAYAFPIDNVEQAAVPDGGVEDRGAIVGLGRGKDGALYAATERYLFKKGPSAAKFELVRPLSIRIDDLE